MLIKDNIPFLKTNWLSLLVLILVGFLFINRDPFGCNPIQVAKSDTVRTEKIQYIPQAPVILTQYTPSATDTVYKLVSPPEYKASEDLITLTKQYNALARDFLATKNYRDSILLKDTFGVQVGIVNLDDDVSKSSIVARRPSYQLNFPLKTITNTITVTAPPKNQFFYGGGITGNKSDIVNGANIGLQFKNKHNEIFGLNTGFQSYIGSLHPQFGVSFYKKIGK